MKLTVIYFPFSKRPKKVNRQKWETIFRKKRKGLNPTDIFPFVFQLLVSSFILIVPFKIKLQKQTQLNAFFLPFFFSPELDFVPPPKKNLRGKFFVQLFYFKKVALGKASKDNDRILPPNSWRDEQREFLTKLARLTS